MKIVNLNLFRYISIVIFATIGLITYVINYEYTKEITLLNQVIYDNKNYHIETKIPNYYLNIINQCEMYYERQLIDYQIKEIKIEETTSILIIETNKINDYMFITKCVYGKTTIKDEIYKFLKEGMIQWKN